MTDPSPDDLGHYAGWGSPEDLKASAATDGRPADSGGAPPLINLPIALARYRGPGTTLMLLYLPATLVALMLELWLGVPLGPALLSLVGLALAFTVTARWLNRRGA